MDETTYILVREFCSHHHLDMTFMELLQQHGLIEISHLEEGDSFPADEVGHLEKMIRLHQELNIHPEDLDIVSDLLDQLESLQGKMDKIKSQLDFFEKQFDRL